MKILLADDDPVTLEALDACVRGEGFTTLLAANGRLALDLWRKHRPDLLCLDIMMPEIDGFEVCRQVRALDPAVPILFLSAKSEEIDVVVGLQLGADDFVRKPFGKHELLARLRSALRRTKSPRAEQRQFSLAGWTVRPDELRAIHADGQAVELSPREIAILALLLERAGQVVPREVLLDRCWGLDYYPESRTLDQHIAKLRKKIEPNLDSPEIIETVRGVGYRYQAQRP